MTTESDELYLRFVCDLQHTQNFEGGLKLQKNACSNYGTICTSLNDEILSNKFSSVCAYNIRQGLFELVEGLCYMHRVTCRNEAGEVMNKIHNYTGKSNGTRK